MHLRALFVFLRISFQSNQTLEEQLLSNLTFTDLSTYSAFSSAPCFNGFVVNLFDCLDDKMYYDYILSLPSISNK